MTSPDKNKVGKKSHGTIFLVVDDNQGARSSLIETLNDNGWQIEAAESTEAVFTILAGKKIDGIFVSIDMVSDNGLELLKNIKETIPGMPVAVITDSPRLETAVSAMKNGAIDYLTKPLSRTAIQEIATRMVNESNNLQLHLEKEEKEVGKKRVIGSDDNFCRLLKKAEAVASSKATVLIYGESGTGKEVFARYIHEVSDRKKGPFVALNCAALPEGLLESELFGHEKGAFTGAIAAKKGKFELADRGTLLLDEIGEIPLHLQAKLLRVLQEEEVDRLGSNSPLTIDAHVIVTTNRDLQAAIKDGSFREDLYYRLNVIPITIPPLRERKTDIFLLADYFIKKFSGQYNKKVKKLSNRARDYFLKYDWPGNVREMENLIERAVLLSMGDNLELHDFWDEAVPEYQEKINPSGEKNSESSGNILNTTFFAGDEDELPTLKDVERQMILQALDKTNNNRTSAAKILGVSVRTLRNKLNEYRNSGVII